jgi:hypothetical protein
MALERGVAVVQSLDDYEKAEEERSFMRGNRGTYGPGKGEKMEF